MKRSFLSQAVGAGVITASLVVMPLTLPVQAQTTTTPDAGTTTVQTGDRDFDWGWLGLLGLIGLAGLARRPQATPTTYRDPAETTRTSDRY